MPHSTGPPQWYTNVEDNAKLHIIALAHREIQNEQIFTTAGPVCLQDNIEILRKLNPDKSWEDRPERLEMKVCLRGWRGRMSC